MGMKRALAAVWIAMALIALTGCAGAAPELTGKSDRPPGVQMVTVPDLFGRFFTEAEATLKAQGLAYREKANDKGRGPTGDVGVGEVFKQSPAAGAQVPRGTTVTIWFQVYE